MVQELSPRDVRRAQQGDQAACELVTQHCRGMFERALSKRGVPPEAREEILQEALLVILRQLAGFQWRAQFDTWALAVLFKVQMRFHQQKAARSQRYTLESEMGAEDDPEAFERIGGANASIGNPERLTLQSLLRQALADCLEPVALEMREVWVRHRFHGQQHNEIAEALHLSINTVGTRVYRTDRKLRDCLERKGFTADTLGVGS